MTNSPGPKPGRGGDPHGWNSLPNYLDVHRSYLDDLYAYFIVGDNLSYDMIGTHEWEIEGRVNCQHGLFLDVHKILEINERDQVRTVKYSYHAGIEGRQNRAIFRYDNAHCHGYAGHKDEHHKHIYDHTTWEQIEPPEWVGRSRWPHLNEAIEKLQDWWEEIGQFLDISEGIGDAEDNDTPSQ